MLTRATGRFSVQLSRCWCSLTTAKVVTGLVSRGRNEAWGHGGFSGLTVAGVLSGVSFWFC